MRKVIQHRDIPTSLPTTFTIAAILAFDRLGLSGFWWGVLLSVLAALWLASIYLMCIEEPESVFKK